jgi:DNA-binding MarR family transcriptional regulator
MPAKSRTSTKRRSNSADAWALTDVVTRLRRVLRASIRSDYPWESLPMAQIEVMQRLRDEPGLRVNDLATRHRLAGNTVSGLVQQLVVAGLVVRATDEHDRRAVRIELTAAGQQMLIDWLAAHERRIDAALARLSSADRRAVVSALPSLSLLIDELERANDPEVSPHNPD